MVKEIKADICIIGAGSGGLATAAGAVQMGARTVLVENHKMGGDCLNYGCVPSKALIAAAQATETARHGGEPFGQSKRRVTVDFKAIHNHVHDVINAIAPHDSVERFEALGVTVIQGSGQFRSPRVIEVYKRKALIARIWAHRFVLATGSRPFIPPISGLKKTNYLTNETIFDLTERPEHLLIIGAGPIGIEMAQAHRRLGSYVTIISHSALLPSMDTDLTAILRTRLEGEGIRIIEGAEISSVQTDKNGPIIRYDHNRKSEQLRGSHILIATGRLPNIEGLALERAGISYSRKGITVDKRLRTTNTKIFAIGDVTGSPQFTHVAGYHSGIVIRNALFRIPAKADHSSVPMVTYTDPEIAQLGLSSDEAFKLDPNCKILKASFSENDRAQTERKTDGLIKVSVRRNGTILGVSIIGPHAGELIQPWILAKSAGLKIGALATMIAPYPTLGEINKRVAGSFYTEALFSRRTQKLVKALSFLR